MLTFCVNATERVNFLHGSNAICMPLTELMRAFLYHMCVLVCHSKVNIGQHHVQMIKHLSSLFYLQVRVEQVLVAEPGAVVLYKLSNLIKFYHSTIR